VSGCSTGNLDGSAPFGFLSTYRADRPAAAPKRLKRFVQIVCRSSDNWNAVIAKPSLLTELRLPDSTTHALIMALVGSAVRQALPMRVAEAKANCRDVVRVK